MLRKHTLLSLAHCKLKKIAHEDNIKRFWPRFTQKRFNRQNDAIKKIVKRQMPFWARKFDKIWDQLTDKQLEVFLLEYFYEGNEKNTQIQNAKKLGIKLSSYKDRLEGAIKKLEKLYPEFERINRKNKNATPKPNLETPAPLYKIENGHKVEIALSKSVQKKLSSLERFKIWQWAYNEDEYQRHEGLFYDDLDEDSTNEWENLDESDSKDNVHDETNISDEEDQELVPLNANFNDD